MLDTVMHCLPTATTACNTYCNAAAMPSLGWQTAFYQQLRAQLAKLFRIPRTHRQCCNACVPALLYTDEQLAE
jgi:hypothetical protein